MSSEQIKNPTYTPVLELTADLNYELLNRNSNRTESGIGHSNHGSTVYDQDKLIDDLDQEYITKKYQLKIKITCTH